MLFSKRTIYVALSLLGAAYILTPEYGNDDTRRSLSVGGSYFSVSGCV